MIIKKSTKSGFFLKLCTLETVQTFGVYYVKIEIIIETGI